MALVSTWTRKLERARSHVRRQRGLRAEERQRAYQMQKARACAGAIDEMTPQLDAYASAVKRTIERVWPIARDTQALEVGSGAHGLVFFLGIPDAIGVDPLADDYAALFPAWQRRAKTRKAYGEALPFENASFDLVLSDNVVDHAEDPRAILREMVRVLRPGGALYFTVHVHHPLYAIASAAHAAWNAAGLHYEITPFADHTVHLTLARVRSWIRELPLRVLAEDTGIEGAKREARTSTERGPVGTAKRAFFKNARFEIVASRI